MLKKFIILFIFLFYTSCGIGFMPWPDNSKQCYCVDPNVILTKEQIEKGARNCTIKAKIDCDKY